MTINVYPSPNGVLTSLIWRFTASGAETSLSGYDDANQALSYTPGQEQVYLNGILLVRGEDYIATNGTSITNLTALAASDYIQVNCYNNFSVASLPASGIVGEVPVANIPSTIARVANPTFTGTPAAPTASAGTDTTQIATTAFVQTAVNGLIDAAPTALNTLNELAAALGDDANYASTVTTALDGKISKSLTTTTGDIIYASGANTPARLGIGTSNQVLTVSGGVPTWATPSSGGGGSLTLLETLTLGSTGVNSSTISGSYTNLLIIIKNVTATGNLDMYMRFNSDTGNNYQIRGVYTY